MLINTIIHNAEQVLLDQVEHSHATWGALYVQSSLLGKKPSEEAVVFTVRDILDGRKATVYFFTEGDIVVTWLGAQKATVETLRKQLFVNLELPDHAVSHYYDSQAQGEELRVLCKQKLAAIRAAAKPLQGISDYTKDQAAAFQKLAKGRTHRKQLEILIVEDQAFSAKLLAGLLGRICKTHLAHTAETALELYLEYAPNIVFLDIELPGMSGHELAEKLRILDPQAHIIMVTANFYAEEVARAKQNGAKGFIAKPYSKQKILDGVEKYIHDHKLNH